MDFGLFCHRKGNQGFPCSLANHKIGMGCRANMERKSLETRQEALCQVSCVQSFSWRHFPTAVYINGASSFIVTDAAFSALIVCLDFASGLYVGLYSVFWFFSVLSPCPIVCVGFFFRFISDVPRDWKFMLHRIASLSYKLCTLRKAPAQDLHEVSWSIL